MKQAQRVFRVRMVQNYAGDVLYWVVTDAPEGNTDMSYPVFAKFPVNDRYNAEKQRKNASVLAHICNGYLKTWKTDKYLALEAQHKANQQDQAAREASLDELDQIADKNPEAHDEMMAALKKASHVEKVEKKPFWKRFFKG